MDSQSHCTVLVIINLTTELALDYVLVTEVASLAVRRPQQESNPVLSERATGWRFMFCSQCAHIYRFAGMSVILYYEHYVQNTYRANPRASQLSR